jgi:hypothetical protein
MMGAVQLLHQVELVTMECGECGIVFAMSSSKYRRCKEKGEGWCCPNGHNRIFCESEIDKLKKELEAERQRKMNALTRENEALAEKAKLERKLKRVHKGVCPCCNRTFVNLGRHMATKHPSVKP